MRCPGVAVEQTVRPGKKLTRGSAGSAVLSGGCGRRTNPAGPDIEDGSEATRTKDKPCERHVIRFDVAPGWVSASSGGRRPLKRRRRRFSTVLASAPATFRHLSRCVVCSDREAAAAYPPTAAACPPKHSASRLRTSGCTRHATGLAVEKRLYTFIYIFIYIEFRRGSESVLMALGWRDGGGG